MATTENEPGSHIVTIYRYPSFLEQAQLGANGRSDNADISQVAAFISESKQTIGSYWEKSTAAVVATGLTRKEIEILMPELVNAEPVDREFRQKVQEYFQNISTKVPYDKGLKLEIGLVNPALELGEATTIAGRKAFNMPLNVYQYIQYKHAQGHPQVALSKDAGEGLQHKWYYIFDPIEAETKLVSENEDRDKAIDLYGKIRDEDAADKNPTKGWTRTEMMLTLMGTDFRTFTGPNAYNNKKDALRKLADTKPIDFVKAHGEKLFDQFFEIQHFLNTGILRENGKYIVDPTSGKTLGHDRNETAAWLLDPAHSHEIALLKQRLQEMTVNSQQTASQRASGSRSKAAAK